jgi:hypothetical protein
MEHGPSWEADIFSGVEILPAFFGTRMFITTFTTARQLFLSSARPIQYRPTNLLFRI